MTLASVMSIGNSGRCRCLIWWSFTLQQAVGQEGLVEQGLEPVVGRQVLRGFRKYSSANSRRGGVVVKPQMLAHRSHQQEAAGHAFDVFGDERQQVGDRCFFG